MVAVCGLRRRRCGGVPIGIADSLGVDSLARGFLPFKDARDASGRWSCISATFTTTGDEDVASTPFASARVIDPDGAPPGGVSGPTPSPPPWLFPEGTDFLSPPEVVASVCRRSSDSSATVLSLTDGVGVRGAGASPAAVDMPARAKSQ